MKIFLVCAHFLATLFFVISLSVAGKEQLDGAAVAGDIKSDVADTTFVSKRQSDSSLHRIEDRNAAAHCEQGSEFTCVSRSSAPQQKNHEMIDRTCHIVETLPKDDRRTCVHALTPDYAEKALRSPKELQEGFDKEGIIGDIELLTETKCSRCTSFRAKDDANKNAHVSGKGRDTPVNFLSSHRSSGPAADADSPLLTTTTTMSQILTDLGGSLFAFFFGGGDYLRPPSSSDAVASVVEGPAAAGEAARAEDKTLRTQSRTNTQGRSNNKPSTSIFNAAGVATTAPQRDEEASGGPHKIPENSGVSPPSEAQLNGRYVAPPSSSGLEEDEKKGKRLSADKIHSEASQSTLKTSFADSYLSPVFSFFFSSPPPEASKEPLFPVIVTSLSSMLRSNLDREAEKNDDDRQWVAPDTAYPSTTPTLEVREEQRGADRGRGKREKEEKEEQENEEEPQLWIVVLVDTINSLGDVRITMSLTHLLSLCFAVFVVSFLLLGILTTKEMRNRGRANDCSANNSSSSSSFAMGGLTVVPRKPSNASSSTSLFGHQGKGIGMLARLLVGRGGRVAGDRGKNSGNLTKQEEEEQVHRYGSARFWGTIETQSEQKAKDQESRRLRRIEIEEEQRLKQELREQWRRELMEEEAGRHRAIVAAAASAAVQKERARIMKQIFLSSNQNQTNSGSDNSISHHAKTKKKESHDGSSGVLGPSQQRDSSYYHGYPPPLVSEATHNKSRRHEMRHGMLPAFHKNHFLSSSQNSIHQSSSMSGGSVNEEEERTPLQMPRGALELSHTIGYSLLDANKKDAEGLEVEGVKRSHTKTMVGTQDLDHHHHHSRTSISTEMSTATTNNAAAAGHPSTLLSPPAALQIPSSPFGGLGPAVHIDGGAGVGVGSSGGEAAFNTSNNNNANPENNKDGKESKRRDPSFDAPQPSSTTMSQQSVDQHQQQRRGQRRARAGTYTSMGVTVLAPIDYVQHSPAFLPSSSSSSFPVFSSPSPPSSGNNRSRGHQQHGFSLCSDVVVLSVDAADTAGHDDRPAPTSAPTTSANSTQENNNNNNNNNMSNNVLRVATRRRANSTLLPPSARRSNPATASSALLPPIIHRYSHDATPLYSALRGGGGSGGGRGNGSSSSLFLSSSAPSPSAAGVVQPTLNELSSATSALTPNNNTKSANATATVGAAPTVVALPVAGTMLLPPPLYPSTPLTPLGLILPHQRKDEVRDGNGVATVNKSITSMNAANNTNNNNINNTREEVGVRRPNDRPAADSRAGVGGLRRGMNHRITFSDDSILNDTSRHNNSGAATTTASASTTATTAIQRSVVPPLLTIGLDIINTACGNNKEGEGEGEGGRVGGVGGFPSTARYRVSATADDVEAGRERSVDRKQVPTTSSAMVGADEKKSPRQSSGTYSYLARTPLLNASSYNPSNTQKERAKVGNSSNSRRIRQYHAQEEEKEDGDSPLLIDRVKGRRDRRDEDYDDDDDLDYAAPPPTSTAASYYYQYYYQQFLNALSALNYAPPPSSSSKSSGERRHRLELSVASSANSTLVNNEQRRGGRGHDRLASTASSMNSGLFSSPSGIGRLYFLGGEGNVVKDESDFGNATSRARHHRGHRKMNSAGSSSLMSRYSNTTHNHSTMNINSNSNSYLSAGAKSTATACFVPPSPPPRSPAPSTPIPLVPLPISLPLLGPSPSVSIAFTPSYSLNSSRRSPLCRSSQSHSHSHSSGGRDGADVHGSVISNNTSSSNNLLPSDEKITNNGSTNSSSSAPLGGLLMNILAPYPETYPYYNGLGTPIHSHTHSTTTNAFTAPLRANATEQPNRGGLQVGHIARAKSEGGEAARNYFVGVRGGGSSNARAKTTTTLAIGSGRGIAFDWKKKHDDNKEEEEEKSKEEHTFEVNSSQHHKQRRADQQQQTSGGRGGGGLHRSSSAPLLMPHTTSPADGHSIFKERHEEAVRGGTNTANNVCPRDIPRHLLQGDQHIDRGGHIGGPHGSRGRANASADSRERSCTPLLSSILNAYFKHIIAPLPRSSRSHNREKGGELKGGDLKRRAGSCDSGGHPYNHEGDDDDDDDEKQEQEDNEDEDLHYTYRSAPRCYIGSRKAHGRSIHQSQEEEGEEEESCFTTTDLVVVDGFSGSADSVVDADGDDGATRRAAKNTFSEDSICPYSIVVDDAEMDVSAAYEGLRSVSQCNSENNSATGGTGGIGIGVGLSGGPDAVGATTTTTHANRTTTHTHTPPPTPPTYPRRVVETTGTTAALVDPNTKDREGTPLTRGQRPPLTPLRSPLQQLKQQQQQSTRAVQQQQQHSPQSLSSSTKQRQLAKACTTLTEEEEEEEGVTTPKLRKTLYSSFAVPQQGGWNTSFSSSSSSFLGDGEHVGMKKLRNRAVTSSSSFSGPPNRHGVIVSFGENESEEEKDDEETRRNNENETYGHHHHDALIKGAAAAAAAAAAAHFIKYSAGKAVEEEVAVASSSGSFKVSLEERERRADLLLLLKEGGHRLTSPPPPTVVVLSSSTPPQDATLMPHGGVDAHTQHVDVDVDVGGGVTLTPSLANDDDHGPHGTGAYTSWAERGVGGGGGGLGDDAKHDDHDHDDQHYYRPQSNDEARRIAKRRKVHCSSAASFSDTSTPKSIAEWSSSVGTVVIRGGTPVHSNSNQQQQQHVLRKRRKDLKDDKTKSERLRSRHNHHQHQTQASPQRLRQQQTRIDPIIANNDGDGCYLGEGSHLLSVVDHHAENDNDVFSSSSSSSSIPSVFNYYDDEPVVDGEGFLSGGNTIKRRNGDNDSDNHDSLDDALYSALPTAETETTLGSSRIGEGGGRMEGTLRLDDIISTSAIPRGDARIGGGEDEGVGGGGGGGGVMLVSPISQPTSHSSVSGGERGIGEEQETVSQQQPFTCPQSQRSHDEEISNSSSGALALADNKADANNYMDTPHTRGHDSAAFAGATATAVTNIAAHGEHDDGASCDRVKCHNTATRSDNNATTDEGEHAAEDCFEDEDEAEDYYDYDDHDHDHEETNNDNEEDTDNSSVIDHYEIQQQRALQQQHQQQRQQQRRQRQRHHHHHRDRDHHHDQSNRPTRVNNASSAIPLSKEDEGEKQQQQEEELHNLLNDNKVYRSVATADPRLGPDRWSFVSAASVSVSSTVTVEVAGGGGGRTTGSAFSPLSFPINDHHGSDAFGPHGWRGKIIGGQHQEGEGVEREGEALTFLEGVGIRRGRGRRRGGQSRGEGPEESHLLECLPSPPFYCATTSTMTSTIATNNNNNDKNTTVANANVSARVNSSTFGNRSRESEVAAGEGAHQETSGGEERESRFGGLITTGGSAAAGACSSNVHVAGGGSFFFPKHAHVDSLFVSGCSSNEGGWFGVGYEEDVTAGLPEPIKRTEPAEDEHSNNIDHNDGHCYYSPARPSPTTSSSSSPPPPLPAPLSSNIKHDDNTATQLLTNKSTPPSAEKETQ